MTTVSIEWQSKAPHSTRWLRFEFPMDDEPAALFAALAEIGFASDGLGEPSPLNGIVTRMVGKRGSGIFGMWTDAERVENVTAAERVIGKQVPYRKMSARELA